MASRDEGVEPFPESRAEAALELLRSLTHAGEDPEKFVQACRDWARLSDEGEALPEFQSVLSMRTAEPNECDARPPHRPSETVPADTLALDTKGRVSSITKDVANQFDLRVGDVLHPSIKPSLATEGSENDFLVERVDRSGISRQIKLYPKIRDGLVTGYTGQVFLYRVSPALRAHLARHFTLTASEIDILELVLRRHRLDQIADLRGIKLNTVRTHVSRLNNKLGCHSLIESIALTVELSHALRRRNEPLHVLTKEDEHASRQITLTQDDQCVEYRRYGSAKGHAVVVLHSLEYGYLPSDEMIAEARKAGVNLVFPLRPGFGATTPTSSIQDSARLLNEFIRLLDLKNITLIGQSTSSPLALEMQSISLNIANTVLVNYGLDVADKLSAIEPKWLSGLLRMGLSSRASFSFGARSLRSISETFGGMRFYRMMYRNQETDLAFLEDNTRIFETISDYLYTADLTHIRRDIETAFLDNPRATSLLSRVSPLMVLNSSDQQGVGPEASQAAAERLGLDFRAVEHPGRNWMFQHPKTLFREIMA